MSNAGPGACHLEKGIMLIYQIVVYEVSMVGLSGHAVKNKGVQHRENQHCSKVLVKAKSMAIRNVMASNKYK